MLIEAGAIRERTAPVLGENMFASFEFAVATAKGWVSKAGQVAVMALGAGLIGATLAGAAQAQTLSIGFGVSDDDGGQLLAGDTLSLTFSLQDFDANYNFEGLTSTLVLSDAYSDLVLAADATIFCGVSGTVGGSAGDEILAFQDGVLSAYSSCSITADIVLPDDIPDGVYTLSPSNVTGTAVHTNTTEVAVDTAVDPATFTVESDTTAPTGSFLFTGDPLPNAPFEAVLAFDEQVTGIEQSDVTITGGTITDFEAAGGGEGASYFANYRITISPTGVGTVTLSTGVGAGTDEAGNDTDAVSDSVEIVDVATASLDIQGGPFDPDDTADFVFTIFNNSADHAISSGSFTIDLDGALDGRDPVPEEAKDADADFSGDVAIMSLCEVLDGACARLPSLWSERGSRAEVRTDLYEQTGDTRFHKAWVELTNEKEY